MLWSMEPTVTNSSNPTATPPSVLGRLRRLLGGIGAWQRAGGEIR